MSHQPSDSEGQELPDLPEFAMDLYRMRSRMVPPRRSYCLSQAEFADRFGLSHGMVKDQEQGRAKPSKPFKVLLAVMEMDPDLVEKAARVAAAKWPED